MRSEYMIAENKSEKEARTEAAYEELVEKFVQWAETRSDIRGAFIVGSRARVDHPADEWADLDITLITTDPERYLSRSDWVENIGNPILTFLEPTATGGGMERRVLFEGMLDVDFAIAPKTKVEYIVQILPSFLRKRLMKAFLKKESSIVNIFRRGMRVLVDKDGMLLQLQTLIPSIENPPPHPPTQSEFLEVINDFLYHAVWTAKKLRRGELWTAKFCLDSYMKWRCILPTIEWHTRATKGWTFDTWLNGRFLEEWADPRALEALHSSFAHYDKDDIKRALLTTMDMFRWIAAETAEKLGYQYSTKADEHVTRWIRNCLDGEL